MIRTIKDSILLNKSILLICLFILIAGFSAGSFFSASMDNTDIKYLSGILTDALRSEAVSLIPILIVNAVFLIMIYLSVRTAYGFPIAACLLFSKSFSIGFCLFLMISQISSIGLSKIIFSFMIPNFVVLLVFLAVITYAMNSKKMPRRTSSIL